MPEYKPATAGAYRLLHRGALAFARMEAAGMRVDVAYLHRAQAKVLARIAQLQARLRDSDTYRAQRRRYGSATKLGSREQLAVILFTDEGHTCHAHTPTGRPQLNDEALAGVGTPYTRQFAEVEKLKKLESTYIRGLLREVDNDGYLHPFFNLHRVATYRSSSSDPNFQNIPIRDKMIAKIIRRAFVPRGPDYQLCETDIGGAEVRCAACYHKDPTMLQYIRTDHDMHKDMAAECFLLPLDQVPKPVRQTAKGSFTFAEFYGDYWGQVAPNLWRAAADLTTADGVPLQDHMAAQGIDGLGLTRRATGRGIDATPNGFAAHIRAVERRFWGDRFAVYDQWRQDWYRAYQAAGGFHTLTGFSVHGVYGRNEVINSPVQGSAFHWLLWCLIRIDKTLRRGKWRTRLIGQIHDSLVADVHRAERSDYLALVKQTFLVDLPAAMPWIITPIEIEAEMCPLGGTWYDKEVVEL